MPRQGYPDVKAPRAAVEWRVSETPVPYERAVAEMEARAEAIAAGTAAEQVWLLTHPPLYTAGTSTRAEDLLQARFPVHRTGRGGQLTYHGPGQRVAYVMLDLSVHGRDVRAFVEALERWIIGTLAAFNVKGVLRPGRVGVWVARDGAHDDKIGAIGIRLRRWVSFHGISLNVDPDLTHYDGIVPCGIRGHGVTSLWALGHTASMAEVDIALRAEFERVFGCPTIPLPAED